MATHFSQESGVSWLDPCSRVTVILPPSLIFPISILPGSLFSVATHFFQESGVSSGKNVESFQDLGLFHQGSSTEVSKILPRVETHTHTHDATIDRFGLPE